jgi:serine/threonine protein kinase
VTASRVCPQCGTAYPANARFCETDGTALRSATPSADLVGAIVADRYCVLRKLGEGGMGQVYLAEHVKMGRKSALKVLHPGLVSDVDAISRFNREAANASRISHPNVAAVYDFGETPDGLIYLAMEFVDGPSLTTLIAQQGALAPPRAAEILRQTADALAAAHDMGIVHRDLKPDNIMLARTRDGGDLVKVVDFGIAKAAGNTAQNVTKTGLVVGTPAYMSPEQLAGDTLDGRSDIYSLALVAFNMLTGRLPFPAETVQESMIMRLTEAPRKLAEMRPDVAWSAEVQAALDKALQRDAGVRYRTATEFGRALSEALERMSAQGPISASPVSESRTSAGNATIPATRARPTRPASVARDDAAATAPTVAPASGRRRFAAYGASGAVLLVVLIGAAMVMNRSAGPAAAADSVTPARPAPSDVKALDTSRYARRIDSAAAPAAGLGVAGVAAALDSLEKVVSGDVTPNEAGRVIRRVEQMKSRIKGNEQLVQAAIVIALAESSRNDNAAACAALRSVQPIAPATTRARQVERTMSVCN